MSHSPGIHSPSAARDGPPSARFGVNPDSCDTGTDTTSCFVNVTRGSDYPASQHTRCEGSIQTCRATCAGNFAAYYNNNSACSSNSSCYAVFEHNSKDCYIKNAMKIETPQTSADPFGYCLYSGGENYSYIKHSGDEYTPTDKTLDICPRQEDYSVAPLKGLPWADQGLVDTNHCGSEDCNAFFSIKIDTDQSKQTLEQQAVTCATACKQHNSINHANNDKYGPGESRNAFIYIPAFDGDYNPCGSTDADLQNSCKSFGFPENNCLCFYRKEDSSWPLSWFGDMHCFQGESGVTDKKDGVFGVLRSNHDLWPNFSPASAVDVQGTMSTQPNCNNNMGSWMGPFCHPSGAPETDGRHIIFQTKGPNNNAATYIGELCDEASSCDTTREGVYAWPIAEGVMDDSGQTFTPRTFDPYQYNDIPIEVWDYMESNARTSGGQTLCVRGIPQ